jgi:cytoskeletal protein RodZ
MVFFMKKIAIALGIITLLLALLSFNQYFVSGRNLYADTQSVSSEDTGEVEAVDEEVSSDADYNQPDEIQDTTAAKTTTQAAGKTTTKAGAKTTTKTVAAAKTTTKAAAVTTKAAATTVKATTPAATAAKTTTKAAATTTKAAATTTKAPRPTTTEEIC